VSQLILKMCSCGSEASMKTPVLLVSGIVSSPGQDYSADKKIW